MSYLQENKIEILTNLFNRSQRLVWAILFVMLAGIFTLSGAVMNTAVVENNGGRMPVRSSYEYSTDQHFTYVEDSSIKYPLLTDRFPFKNYIYSIGDLTMFIGIILNIILSVYLVMVAHKLEKIKKRHSNILKGGNNG